MPTFNSGFPGVARSAKTLGIAQIEGPLRRITDGADMIHLHAPAGTALDAGPAVAFQNDMPQNLPAPG